MWIPAPIPEIRRYFHMSDLAVIFGINRSEMRRNLNSWIRDPEKEIRVAYLPQYRSSPEKPTTLYHLDDIWRASQGTHIELSAQYRNEIIFLREQASDPRQVLH